MSLFVVGTAMAVDVSPDGIKNKLLDATNTIPTIKKSFEAPEIYQIGGANFGSSRAAQGAANFVNGSQQNRSYGQRTVTKYVDVKDYGTAQLVMQAVGASASTSKDFDDAHKLLGANETSFANNNIKSGSLTSIVVGDDNKPGSAGSSGHVGVASADVPIESVFEAFKQTTTTQSSLLAAKFAADAQNPPELQKAKEDAQKKFEEEQARAQAEMNRQAMSNGNRSPGGGSGGGGAGGGGGGGGLEAPKIADPSRGVASTFDPSKIPMPKASNDIASALANAGSGADSAEKRDSGPLINPVTMSNGGFPTQQVGDNKMLADTSSDKGFKLGGPKSVPQTLTAAGAGGFPANNAQNAGGAGGTPGLGSGKGTPGGDTISGDPYSGVGKEAPYKSVNYNLVKDGGYGAGGGGGEEGGGDGEKEGEVDGGNAEAKEMISNITRPGQFLPAAGNAETGYPGIFAYRGYIRKVCTIEGAHDQVALCKRPINFTKRPETPAVDAESFIASVQKKP